MAAADTLVGFSTETNEPSTLPSLSVNTQATSVEDAIAVCDEPLAPSPRIPVPSATSSEFIPVPIEVWTEDTAVDPATCPQFNSDGRLDEMDELCTEDQPLHPAPCPSDVPADNCTADSQPDPDPSSGRLDDDRDELCIDDVPSEASALPEVEIHPSQKLEERRSLVDEDRDIDTTETLAPEMKGDPLVDAIKWNGVEKSRVTDWPSTVMNGYPDDDDTVRV